MKIEYLKLYWCKIRVYDDRGRAYGIKECKIWDDLQFNLISKYRWYFDYRAALLKVQYPKCEVEIKTGSKEPNKKTVQDFLKDKITGKKRMITKLSNEIKLHKNWLIANNIFGIDGDDGRLEKSKIKLQKYIQELQELETTI